MNTSYNNPTDSEIIVSDFARASSAPSILMHTWFLGPKKPQKGCALDLRKYGMYIQITSIDIYFLPIEDQLFGASGKRYFSLG